MIYVIKSSLKIVWITKKIFYEAKHFFSFLNLGKVFFKDSLECNCLSILFIEADIKKHGNVLAKA